MHSSFELLTIILLFILTLDAMKYTVLHDSMTA